MRARIIDLIGGLVGWGPVRFLLNLTPVWLKRLGRLVLGYGSDPTRLPPPAYTRLRADIVYGEAFRRCVEFVSMSRIPGDFMEFGTLRGYTARWLEYDVGGRLWLFDSFEGLPEITAESDRQSYEVSVNRVWFKGQMQVEPAVEQRIQRALSLIVPPDRLHIVKGYFEETLPENLPVGKVALVHLDCDLYASAKFVLETLIGRRLLQDGSLLLFDDYNSNRASPRMGERLAIVEAFEDQAGYSYSPWFSYGWHGQVFFVHEDAPC